MTENTQPAGPVRSELNFAIASASEAAERLRSAEAKFGEKYPGEYPLLSLGEPWQERFAEYRGDQHAVFILRSHAELTSMLVDQMRAAIAECAREARGD